MFNNTKLKKFTSMLCASLMIGTSSCFYKDRAGAQVIYYDENSQEITDPEDYCNASKVGFDSPTCILLVYNNQTTSEKDLTPFTTYQYWNTPDILKEHSDEWLHIKCLPIQEFVQNETKEKLYQEFSSQVQAYAVINTGSDWTDLSIKLDELEKSANCDLTEMFNGLVMLSDQQNACHTNTTLWGKYTRKLSLEDGLETETQETRLICTEKQKTAGGKPVRQPTLLYAAQNDSAQQVKDIVKRMKDLDRKFEEVHGLAERQHIHIPLSQHDLMRSEPKVQTKSREVDKSEKSTFRLRPAKIVPITLLTGLLLGTTPVLLRKIINYLSSKRVQTDTKTNIQRKTTRI